MRRAVSKSSSFFGREKAGAGIVGLVPQRAVELARMATRFMHGERQMFRIEDEIVQTWLSSGRLYFLNGLRRDARGLGQEIGVLDQFIAHPKKRRIEAPRGEPPIMNRRGIEIAVHGQEVEFQARSFGRHKELAVPTGPQARTAPHDARLPVDILHRLKEQRRFLFKRDGKRIDPLRRHNVVSMNRLIGELHFFDHQRRRAFRNLDGQIGHTRGFFQRKHRTGRKTPGAVIEDADPKPSVLHVLNGRDAAVFAANGLGRTVEEADIAILGPGGHHAFQREFGEFVPTGSAHRVTAFVRSERISNGVSITGSRERSQRIRRKRCDRDRLEQSGNTGRDLFLNDRGGFRNIEILLADVTHHPHLLHFRSRRRLSCHRAA